MEVFRVTRVLEVGCVLPPFNMIPARPKPYRRLAMDRPSPYRRLAMDRPSPYRRLVLDRSCPTFNVPETILTLIWIDHRNVFIISFNVFLFDFIISIVNVAIQPNKGAYVMSS